MMQEVTHLLQLFFFVEQGRADFSIKQGNEYLQELENRSTACAINMELGSVDLPTRCGLTKTVLAASKGTVVTLADGTKVDARLVKNGTGGMRHRMHNNKLKRDVFGNSKEKTNATSGFDDREIEEAIKRSKEDEMNDMKWNEEMINYEEQVLKDGDKKIAAVVIKREKGEDGIIEIDDND